MATTRFRREDNASARPVRLHALLQRSLGLAAVLLLALASFASAQQYQTDAVDENAGKLKLTAEQCVKNPGRFSTDGDRFREFFEKYYFPAMTRYAPNDLAQIGRMRDDLFSRFLWASSDENLQKALTDMAFNKLRPVERSPKYHPAVRYNAILILGMLDATYAIQGAPNERPPVPLKEGTAELTLIVNFAADGKPVPPFLVVGALVGLQRHALYHDKLDRASVDAMSAAVLKLATKDEPLPEVDPKVAEWVRVQTATVLAKLGSPGPNGDVQAMLATMIAGQTVPKMPLDTRCQVAALLAHMKYEGATVDGKATAEALLQLALEVGDDEAKEAKAFQEMNIQGGGGFGGGFGGAYGGSPRSKGRLRLDPETQEWRYDARVLLARLDDLESGLTAGKAIAPADKQPVFDAVLSAIGPAVAAAESSDTIDLEKVEKVVDMATQIRGAVKPGSAPAEAADAGALF